MAKIERLTPEQEAELPRFRQRVLDIACGGGRIDREALHAALADAYAEIGKPAPRLFIFDSPAACMLALKTFKLPESNRLRDQPSHPLWNVFKDQFRSQLWDSLEEQLGDQLEDKIWDQLWDQFLDQPRAQLEDQLRDRLKEQIKGQLRDELRGQLRDELWDQLWDQLGQQLRGKIDEQLRGQLREELRDQLRDQLFAQLFDQLGGGLRGQLGGQLWHQLRDRLGHELGRQLWHQLGGRLGDQLRSQIWGQLRGWLRSRLQGRHIYDDSFMRGSQDLYWIAWARFATWIGVELEAETARHLGIMERISHQCEWWWPYEGGVVASERPVRVHWDDAGRLHRADGPAVEYADGYALAAWHGQAIPLDWVTGRPPSAADALHWPDMDQRAAACEMLKLNTM